MQKLKEHKFNKISTNSKTKEVKSEQDIFESSRRKNTLKGYPISTENKSKNVNNIKNKDKIKKDKVPKKLHKNYKENGKGIITVSICKLFLKMRQSNLIWQLETRNTYIFRK